MENTVHQSQINHSSSIDMNDEKRIDQISTESFLNFLSTSYKLNGIIEGTTDSNQFDINQLTINQNESIDQFGLKLKLNQILNEGLLDSILPYIIPSKYSNNPNSNNTPNIKKPLLDKTNTSGSSGTKSMKYQNDKQSEHTGFSHNYKLKQNKNSPHSINEDKKDNIIPSHSGGSQKDIEVEIHVCDEVKNLKRDFKCSQKLLLSKMGYFAQVTMGQKLEEMDISVHCDINIFEWLMRWVKKDDKTGNRIPELDCCNVIAVLVSANFLQMEPLLKDCLQFCKLNMNEIIRSSNNLICINDSVLTRIANQFSNIQIEDLDDKKDKIRSRLFCKLIFNLNDWPPDSSRGHWASTKHLYRCNLCEKLLAKSYSSRIQCKSSNMQIDSNGNLLFIHEKDPTWSLNEHIRQLKIQLKDWSKVYWKLWSQCHILYCILCNQLYPVIESLCCAYHTQTPQFLCLDTQKLLLCPIGRYACCGGKAYRFEALYNLQGCHFKPHSPRIVLPSEDSIQRTIEKFSNHICQEPPHFIYPPEKRLARVLSISNNTDETNLNWWHGLSLIPNHNINGFLRSKGINRNPPRPESSLSSNEDDNDDDDSDIENDEDDEEDDENEEDDDDSESGSGGEEEIVKPKKMIIRKYKHSISHSNKQNRISSIHHWSSKLSTRFNQDNQREFEENIFSSMAGQLVHQTHNKSYQFTTYLGGAYMKLEQQWKDSIRHTPPPTRNKSRRGL